MKRALVVGAGIFGVTAALELLARGWRVTLLEPGPVPHPLAASTDVSKVVRIEYGADALYTALGERSLEGWRAWNASLPEPLFHETGVLFLRPDSLSPGTFEGDSERALRARGHHPEVLDRAALARRFPQWREGPYEAALFHRLGGWVESGRVVRALLERALAQGAELVSGEHFASVEGSRDQGFIVRTREGRAHAAERVVLAMGAWTPFALPALASAFRPSAMPVFHLRPREPSRFEPPAFPVFGADLSGSGWYGFPLHPREGVVKIARHQDGPAMHPEAPERVVTEEQREQLWDFVRASLPGLADAALVHTRVCLYCDTRDGDFWIDEDPARPGVVVAAGGSGHAFKFAPVLGGLIADAVEGGGEPASRERFRWREGAARGREAARAQ